MHRSASWHVSTARTNTSSQMRTPFTHAPLGTHLLLATGDHHELADPAGASNSAFAVVMSETSAPRTFSSFNPAQGARTLTFTSAPSVTCSLVLGLTRPPAASAIIVRAADGACCGWRVLRLARAADGVCCGLRVLRTARAMDGDAASVCERVRPCAAAVCEHCAHGACSGWHVLQTTLSADGACSTWRVPRTTHATQGAYCAGRVPCTTRAAQGMCCTRRLLSFGLAEYMRGAHTCAHMHAL